MGRYTQSANTKPQKHLAKMLDESAVLSNEFKSALWLAACWMESEAYERGVKSVSKKKKGK